MRLSFNEHLYGVGRTIEGDDAFSIDLYLDCSCDKVDLYSTMIPFNGKVVIDGKFFNINYGFIDLRDFTYRVFYGSFCFVGKKTFDIIRPIKSITNVVGKIYSAGNPYAECELDFRLKHELTSFIKSFRLER